MLTRLSKTLSTNVAIAGLTAVVLGAGGATASLAASHSPNPKPDTTRATDTASETPDPATDDTNEPSESPDAQGEDNGTQPTDTHGYCVSQVAKAAPTAPTGTGDAKVTHGTLVSAAAKACGRPTPGATPAATPAATPSEAAKTKHGKAYGKNHGTGRPAAVTPGTNR